MIVDRDMEAQFNMKYLFLFNKSNIFYYPLIEVPNDQTKTKLDLEIHADENSKEAYDD